MGDTMRDGFEVQLPEPVYTAGTTGILGEDAFDAAQMHACASAAFERGRQLGMEQARSELAKTSEAVPEGYMLVLVPKEPAGGEPDWDECIHQAELATGLKVERNTLSIVIREVRRWLHQRATQQPAAERVELTVWFGSMPESNGKRNWTVLLRRNDASGLRGDISNGFCVSRSEYYDQMRYCADRLRFLIGELAECPSILDYPGDTKEPPANGIGTTEQAKGQT